MKKFLILIFLILSLSGFSQNFFWSHTPDKICFGYLYNWYSVDESIGDTLTSSDDWSVSTRLQYDSLIAHVGGSSVAGGKLRLGSTLFWNGTVLGTDDYGFSAKGGGVRQQPLYTFESIKEFALFHCKDEYSTTGVQMLRITDNSNSTSFSTGGNKAQGASIRLVKDATGLSDGVTTTYTGNDGKTYDAVVINELYWLTENLEETEYRDNSTIPNVTDNTAWSYLTTGAWCTYNNSEVYRCK